MDLTFEHARTDEFGQGIIFSIQVFQNKEQRQPYDSAKLRIAQ